MAEVPRMPRDTYGQSIPILGVLESGAHALTTSAASARTAADFAAQTEIVTLFSTAACWVQFGSSSVTAAKPTSPFDGNANIFVPANVFVDMKIVPKGSVRIAAIQDTATGTLHIWERA